MIDSDLALFAAAWPSGLPEGVIHADFFPDNVFFAKGGSPPPIDFYFAACDALAYDIGGRLNAWCFEPDGSFNVTPAQAFVAGLREPPAAVARGARGPADPGARRGDALLPDPAERLGRHAGRRAGAAEGSAGIRAQAGGAPRGRCSGLGAWS